MLDLAEKCSLKAVLDSSTKSLLLQESVFFVSKYNVCPTATLSLLSSYTALFFNYKSFWYTAVPKHDQLFVTVMRNTAVLDSAVWLLWANAWLPHVGFTPSTPFLTPACLYSPRDEEKFDLLTILRHFVVQLSTLWREKMGEKKNETNLIYLEHGSEFIMTRDFLHKLHRKGLCCIHASMVFILVWVI